MAGVAVVGAAAKAVGAAVGMVAGVGTVMEAEAWVAVDWAVAAGVMVVVEGAEEEKGAAGMEGAAMEVVAVGVMEAMAVAG